jgi:hypothetical protein
VRLEQARGPWHACHNLISVIGGGKLLRRGGAAYTAVPEYNLTT